MIKHLLLSTALALTSLWACAAEEAPGQSFEAGVHYDLINPAIRTPNPDKIEVDLGNTFIGLSSNHIESCTLSDYE